MIVTYRKLCSFFAPLVRVVVVSSFLAGCVRTEGQVRVAAGSTVNHLVFDIVPSNEDEPEPIDALAVDGGPLAVPSRSSAPHGFTWFVARRASTPAARGRLREIQYGVAPPGFAQAAPALPLVPGDYSVQIRAGRSRAAMIFTVEPNGTIRETSP